LEFFSSANSTIFANFIVKFRHNFDTEKRKLKRWWGAGGGVLLGVITFRFLLHICGWVLEFGKEARANFAPQALCVCGFCIKLFAGVEPPAKKERKLWCCTLTCPCLVFMCVPQAFPAWVFESCPLKTDFVAPGTKSL